MPYSYQTFGALKAALLNRLQDALGVFTTLPECGLYLTEALRTLNSLCALWNADYSLTFAPGARWVSLVTSPSLPASPSPRVRTVTDSDIYTLMEYHLLEPATGGTWTGSTQFTIQQLSQSLQYRRDELLQASGANVVSFTVTAPTAGVRTVLPDTILDLKRVRWHPVAPLSEADAYPLTREDRPSANAYGDQLSLAQQNPDSWMITANAPLQFDCSSTPQAVAKWDLLALESGAALNPPATTILGLPDDWCWVAKWGALADLLAASPEALDIPRAKYCLERYQKGMKAMITLPWLVSANISDLPVDTPSVLEADSYSPNWEVTWPAGDPQIVVGGMDLVAVSPFPTVAVGAVLTVVGNAPVPTSDGVFVQLARDGVDAVLAYAQHLAMFKQGGAEFLSSVPLLEQFDSYCRSQNARYAALGITRPLMIQEGDRQEQLDPRFGPGQFEPEEVTALRQQARIWNEASGGR